MATIRKRKTRKGRVVFDVEIRRKGFAGHYRTFRRITDAKHWIQDTESGMRRSLREQTESLSEGMFTLLDVLDI